MKEAQAFFVTGTDTDAGKTTISCGILAKARQMGLTTLGMKPVASGCEMTARGLRNADAVALSALTTLPHAYDDINPVTFLPAIAPHIAAEQMGEAISSGYLLSRCENIMKQKANITLIEGAGGWRVPLDIDRRVWLSDLPQKLDIPVILVVGVKLGCINHAVLSAETIMRDGVTISGWIANQTDSGMKNYDENISTLKRLMPGMFMGSVPYLENPAPENVASYLFMDEYFNRVSR